MKYKEHFCLLLFFSRGTTALVGQGILVITLRHSTLSSTPLDEWSARSRDCYLTTHNTDKRQTSMPPAGFEPHNLSKRETADPLLRPRRHWVRHFVYFILTPWSRVLREKKTGSQLVKKFPALYATRWFITAFTSARHLSLS